MMANKRPCGRCGVVHRSAAEMRECFNRPLPERTPVPAGLARDRATDKQLGFARKLMDRVGWGADRLSHPLEEYDKRSISGLIDELLAQPTVPRTVGTSLDDGMYLKNGVIYKVQHAVHGSGRQYAKRLHVVTEATRDDEGDIIAAGTVRFDYEPGMIGTIVAADRMTMEQAEAFGALYGTCVRCGRTLTKEKSIARAMGPVCAGKM